MSGQDNTVSYCENTLYNLISGAIHKHSGHFLDISTHPPVYGTFYKIRLIYNMDIWLTFSPPRSMSTWLMDAPSKEHLHNDIDLNI